MAKVKKLRKHTAPPPKHPHKPKPGSQPQPPPKQKSKATVQHQQASQQAPIPFNAADDILLVGEGDLSFAHSLLKYHAHRFNSLTATTLETREELLEKYPQTERYIANLLAANAEATEQAVPGELEQSGQTSDFQQNLGNGEEHEVDHDHDTFEGFSPRSSPDHPEPDTPASPNTTRPPSAKTQPSPPNYTVHHSVDATTISNPPNYRKISSTHKRGFTTIIFNFPHVGGKSTDVNRQVRYNQEMLHSFLGQGKVVLERGVEARRQAAKRAREERRANGVEGEEDGKRVHGRVSATDEATGKEKGGDCYDTSDEEAALADLEEAGFNLPSSSSSHRQESAQRTNNSTTATHNTTQPPKADPPTPTPKILITLFEGPPYTLWNIKDLARSVGLECKRSWRFEWALFPGYAHARTVGNLRSKSHASRGEMGGGHEEEGGDGGGDEEREAKRKEDGKPRTSGPGWKGEQREARTYEFGLKKDGRVLGEGGKGGKGKRKRKGDVGSDSD